MSVFYKHEWDEENREVTLYINPTEAFYEFSVEYVNQKRPKERKEGLLIAVRTYVNENLPQKTTINSYRIKFQQFLIAVFKEKDQNVTMEPENIEFGYFKVRKDDTLREISNLLQVRQAELMENNHLTNDTLLVGMELMVPIYRHTVISSDSLQKIAQRFDSTREAIRRMNNLTTDCLTPGLELKVPRSTINEH
ncbi:LysM peptidoglycan-binding domain-containing protein [Sutcliffiella deserti]|uniref:LysM peptidoglycan-binding domain-containing protein n=1 Tax=Sutcliffiella deserti TaxID=2875501 RepID=UPI001CBF79CA|nr:LysM peptidoglycan-binding domain-containing protein [Sutcliffiella deserti]